MLQTKQIVHAFMKREEVKDIEINQCQPHRRWALPTWRPSTLFPHADVAGTSAPNWRGESQRKVKWRWPSALSRSGQALAQQCSCVGRAFALRRQGSAPLSLALTCQLPGSALSASHNGAAIWHLRPFSLALRSGLAPFQLPMPDPNPQQQYPSIHQYSRFQLIPQIPSASSKHRIDHIGHDTNSRTHPSIHPSIHKHIHPSTTHTASTHPAHIQHTSSSCFMRDINSSNVGLT